MFELKSLLLKPNLYPAILIFSQKSGYVIDNVIVSSVCLCNVVECPMQTTKTSILIPMLNLENHVVQVAPKIVDAVERLEARNGEQNNQLAKYW